MKDLLITGTDTEVGKTHVAAALIKHLTDLGQKVAPMKPVASGAVATPAGLRNEDALTLIKASGHSWDYDQVNPYCFEPPIAPHIAAAEAGVAVDIDHLLGCHRELAKQSDRVVIEGAGGFCIPLGPDLMFGDFAARTGAAVIVVVGMRLGCINHALLTVRAIASQRLTLAGWIANEIDPGMDRYDENLATLDQWISFPRMGVMRHGSDLELSMRLG